MTLITQPLMQNLMADLCVEAEAHTITALHMANAFNSYYQHQAAEDEEMKDVFRVGVSVTKYFITKRLPNFTYECLEVIYIYIYINMYF